MAEMLALVVMMVGGLGLTYNFVTGAVPILSDIGDVPIGIFFVLAGAYGYLA